MIIGWILLPIAYIPAIVPLFQKDKSKRAGVSALITVTAAEDGETADPDESGVDSEDADDASTDADDTSADEGTRANP